LQKELDTASRSGELICPSGRFLGLMRPLGIYRVEFHRFP